MKLRRNMAYEMLKDRGVSDKKELQVKRSWGRKELGIFS